MNVLCSLVARTTRAKHQRSLRGTTATLIGPQRRHKLQLTLLWSLLRCVALVHLEMSSRIRSNDFYFMGSDDVL